MSARDERVIVIVSRLDRADLQRLADVLAHPDPPELRRRGMRWTQAGDPIRRQTVLLPLLIRWAGHRCRLADPPPMIAPVGARTSTQLRLVTADTPRRTA